MLICLKYFYFKQIYDSIVFILLFLLCFSAVSIKKTHILKLDQTGRFAINVFDNLILVHHQTSKVDCFFICF